MSKSCIRNHDTLKIKLATKPKKELAQTQTVNGAIDTLFMYFYMAIPLLLAAACVYPAVGPYIPLLQVCDMFDEYLLSLGAIQKAGVSLEAVIACVCWATSYLFVRRLLNPENDGQAALRKFSADSFYGGLAAAASVFAKAYLLTNMVPVA